MKLQDQLESVAQQLLEEAMKPGTAKKPGLSTKEKVDIFKATSTWYLGVKKANKGESDDDDAGSSFQDLRRRINPNGAVQ